MEHLNCECMMVCYCVCWYMCVCKRYVEGVFLFIPVCSALPPGFLFGVYLAFITILLLREILFLFIHASMKIIIMTVHIPAMAKICNGVFCCCFAWKNFCKEEKIHNKNYRLAQELYFPLHTQTKGKHFPFFYITFTMIITLQHHVL